MATQNTGRSFEELTSAKTNLKRTIGVFGGISVVGGMMIGSAIFYTSAYVLDYAGGNIMLSIIAWIVAGLLCLGSGMCYAEMGSLMPQSGGGLVYIGQAYGPVASFCSGWSGAWVSQTGGTAAIAMAGAEFIGSLFGGFTPMQVSIVSCAMVLILGVINYFGADAGSKVSSILFVVKVAAIVGVIAACVLLGPANGDPLLAPVPQDVNPIGAIMLAVTACLWCYDGFNTICTVAEEVKEPQKNIPKIVAGSVLGVGALYLLFHLSIIKVLPVDAIMASENVTYDVMELIFGKGAAVVVTVCIVCSIIGTTNSCVLAYPRSTYFMAREGRWFPQFGKVSKKTRVPVVALAFFTIVTAALCFMPSFQTLVNICVLESWVWYILIALGVGVLRKRYPNVKSDFRVPAYPIVAGLVTLFGVFMLVYNFVSDPITAVGLLVPISGIPAYYAFQAYFKKHGYPKFDDEALEE